MGAWVTDECAIKMTSGKSQEIDLSFDLGATGIGKLGVGAGAFDKLKREGWWTYPKNEKSEGYVVSFAGVEYSLRSLHKFRSTPLKVYNETISLPPPKHDEPESAEREQRKALAMKYLQIQQIENEEERHAELEKLLQELKNFRSEA
ncbi:hypothetical protein BJX68DRAFT_273698 [Aspergillus pseudodeflectus]|uniref:Uncharacterized protein n=1 Tax=Aspergillus pseudodeflectus TaxID=176178 RepID=A0ABR4J7W5_9EURO